MKQIPLPNGDCTVVDDEDFDVLNRHKWSVTNKGYVVRAGPRPKRRQILLHRVVNQTPDGLQTDHINGNKLDNRRCNLRSATNTTNQWNSKHAPRSTNTHGFKGARFDKRFNAYHSQITVNGKSHYLGYFKDPQSASKAYFAAAKRLHGEFARTTL